MGMATCMPMRESVETVEALAFAEFLNMADMNGDANGMVTGRRSEFRLECRKHLPETSPCALKFCFFRQFLIRDRPCSRGFCVNCVASKFAHKSPVERTLIQGLPSETLGATVEAKKSLYAFAL